MVRRNLLLMHPLLLHGSLKRYFWLVYSLFGCSFMKIEVMAVRRVCSLAGYIYMPILGISVP